MPALALRLALLLLAACCALPALAQSPRILFVRGGPGTGGFLGGGSDEQLSDITNFSTASGNHGWGQLADTLRAAGFDVEQRIEGPAEDNTPVDLAGLDLAAFAVIVLGSNNANYPEAAVDAVDQFIRAGGGLLVISDANWGQDWGDAPSSDQPFLDRYGLIMNQDRGTYVLERSTGDFVVGGTDQGSHPVLLGIEAFDGEGVSPLTLGDPMDDVTVRVLANAEGVIRLNDDDSGGSTRPATDGDGALVVVEAGAGRVAGHFDRNTFFNENGAGTDLTRFDNARYAKQLFGWLAGTLPTDTASPPALSPVTVWGPHPNPSRGSARFGLRVASPQRVLAEVLDVRGRHLRTVFDGILTTEATVELRGDLPAGTYFLSVTSETGSDTRSFQVLR